MLNENEGELVPFIEQAAEFGVDFINCITYASYDWGFGNRRTPDSYKRELDAAAARMTALGVRCKSFPSDDISWSEPEAVRLHVLLGAKPAHHLRRRRHARLLLAVHGDLLVRERAGAAVQRDLEQRAVPEEPCNGQAAPGARHRRANHVMHSARAFSQGCRRIRRSRVRRRRAAGQAEMTCGPARQGDCAVR